MLLLELLAFMWIAHAICDYPLQGDWLSKAKNPTLTLVPGEQIWPLALLSHAAIHAGAVRLITGSWLLACFEFVAHTCIDYSKCRNCIGYNFDQALHLACKLLWIALLMWGIA
ncbi:DUF3307 domain-containing protein [Bradyrhizobium sp. PMVTL-01]|uniref:DUF3307 domain-containing protein n=1 Tax=Bradyrhizobium sp. PMVTL-01 TaxID=3434999 RepID=UPI003F720A56